MKPRGRGRDYYKQADHQWFRCEKCRLFQWRMSHAQICEEKKCDGKLIPKTNPWKGKEELDVPRRKTGNKDGGGPNGLGIA